MRRAKRILVGMSLAVLVCSNLHAQDDSDKINSNMRSGELSSEPNCEVCEN